MCQIHLCGTSRNCCLISLFNIKPQPLNSPSILAFSCLISLFYIKPQPTFRFTCAKISCLISLFYIKPQLPEGDDRRRAVVLYLCSTSNHNSLRKAKVLHEVVLYLCSTSNHNFQYSVFSHLLRLSYIFVLHQTTTLPRRDACSSGCLISLFYIKPQQEGVNMKTFKVVLYLCSTSNHNLPVAPATVVGVVLYLCSTSNHNG